jgi:hypothetical protein
MSSTACTESQCLNKDALYVFIIFDGMACRLPVFWTKVETFQNGDTNIRLLGGGKYRNKRKGEHVITAVCLGQLLICS